MADIDVNSLEPNSHKYKAEKANGGNKKEPGSREKVSPIVKRDQVVSTKKPLGKKFAETFMTEDAKDVKSWLLMDVIIPGVKNTILDILSMMFFGEVDNRRRGGNAEMMIAVIIAVIIAGVLLRVEIAAIRVVAGMIRIMIAMIGWIFVILFFGIVMMPRI